MDIQDVQDTTMLVAVFSHPVHPVYPCSRMPFSVALCEFAVLPLPSRT